MARKPALRTLFLTVSALLLGPAAAAAQTVVNISYNAATITRFPLPFPSGTVATTFTGYTGTSFPFAMETFQVGTTGNYSLTVGGIGGGVGIFVIEGTFAPASASNPTTPLANVLAGTQAPATIPSIALQAGVQYTFLVVVSAGTGTGTVTIAGGCVVIGTQTCAPEWSNAGAGDWDTAANWSTGSEPTSTDGTSINNGGTARVTTAGNASGNLLVGAGAGNTGTLEVAGGSLTAAGLEAGRDAGSSGTVLVNSGGSLTQSAGSAFDLGASGGVATATVEGAGSVINWVGGTPRVGAGGTGTLTVEAGGRFAATSLELSGSGGTSTVRVGTGAVAGVLDTNVQTGAGPGPATLTFNHSNNIAFAHTIAGAVAVTKLGAGSLTLTGANTHSTTVVQAGTLFVNGTQPTSGVTVQGGILGGTGTLGQLSATGGTVAPGLSPGRLTVAAAALSAPTTFFVELNGPAAGTAYDQLAVLGNVSLGNATLSGSTSTTHAPGAQFVVIDKQGPGAVSGTFNGLAEGATVGIGSNTFRVSYAGGDGNDVVLTAIGAIGLAPGTLPAITVGVPFTVTFTATGGVAPYIFSVSAGTLPAGLALDGSTGELSGTPTAAGPFSFTIMATDSLGVTQVQAYSGTIVAPVPSLPFLAFLALALMLAGLGYRRLKASA